MKLRDYLHFNRISATELAKKLGVHANYLRLISCEKTEPSLELAVKIELITDGEVTIRDVKKVDEINDRINITRRG